jgi:hypothetical protein
MPMVNFVSIRTQRPGESNLTIPFLLSDLGSGEEHIAQLANPSRFGLFRRWDGLLDEGVAAVFGLASGEAELLALSFHAGMFTPHRAATWLAERGFKPLIFVPNSISFADDDFDAPRIAPVGRAVSGNSTRGEGRWKTRTSCW